MTATRLERSFVPMTFIPERSSVSDQPMGHDARIIEAVGRALYWESLLDDGHYGSISALARAEGLQPTTVARLLRLARLSPDVIDLLMHGEQSSWLTLYWLQRHDIPAVWTEQLALFTGARP